jgi:pimeloyl-[acyl-carrier protein] synthase
MSLLSPETLANPYPLAQSLRERDPVHWSPELKTWVLSRYADVAASLHDARFSADRLPPLDRLAELGLEPVRPLYATMRRMLTFLDPPDHARLRRLANRGFTRRAVEGWRADIHRLVDAALDRARARGGLDIVADLARPLPLAMISLLLGIPESEAPRLSRWSGAMGRFFGRFSHTERQLLDVQTQILECATWLRERIARLRREPNGAGDLLAALAHDARDAMGDDELVSTAILLVGAGTVTTTDLIGNVALALLQHPEHARQFRASAADARFVEAALEELIRYDSPVQMTGRLLSDDVEIHGRTLRRGQWAVLWIGSANRDPARFPAPETIDFTRPDNKHLAFGSGAHFCLGAPLARLQAQIAIGTLFARFPEMRLATGSLTWERLPTLRGLTSLPVTLQPS